MPRPRSANPSPEALRKRRERARRRQEREANAEPSLTPGGTANAAEGVLTPLELPEPPSDPAAAVAEWAEAELIVPTGLLRGQPLRIPEWQRGFLEKALAPGVGQAGLSVARKNGKSGLVAVLLLAHLAGPLRREAWRGVVVSLTANHARELRDAMAELIASSGLRHLELRLSPHPGRILGPHNSRVDFLASDKATGHALGCDLAVIDEAGLLEEAQRSLWNALLTSTSGREGRLISISIRGHSPMFEEMMTLAQEHPKEAAWVEYAAPVDCQLDDEAAWHAGNPGLATGIKSIEYMRRQSARALTLPRNAQAFRSYDLNQPGEPEHNPIVGLAEWRSTAVDELPSDPADRHGHYFVGVDFGSTGSMSAIVAYWPKPGIIDGWAAWPRLPTLEERGAGDGVGDLYRHWHDEGWLLQYGNRITDNVAFARDVLGALCEGFGQPRGIGADRYKENDLREVVDSCGLTCPLKLRGTLTGSGAEAAADIDAFRRAFYRGQMQHDRNPIAEHGIRCSAIDESSGLAHLSKAAARGRIDWVSAAVVAAGIARVYAVEIEREGLPQRNIYHGMV